MKDIEYETKVLEIVPTTIIADLVALGAKDLNEKLYKRWVFEMERGEWIRLRTDGTKTTLAYKNRNGTKIGATTEIETEVADFERMYLILSKLSFANEYYQENKTHIFTLGDLEFSLDTWPMIPAYLEIEGKDPNAVKKGLKMLGLNGKEIGDVSTVDVYEKHGINLHEIKHLSFSAG